MGFGLGYAGTAAARVARPRELGGMLPRVASWLVAQGAPPSGRPFATVLKRKRGTPTFLHLAVRPKTLGSDGLARS